MRKLNVAAYSGKARDARRKRNRERMARVRKGFKRKNGCRVCGDVVTVSERTGRPSSLCAGHLAADRARKTPPELPWGDPHLDYSLVGARRIHWAAPTREGRPIDIRTDHRGRVALLDGQYRYLLAWRK